MSLYAHRLARIIERRSREAAGELVPLHGRTYAEHEAATGDCLPGFFEAPAPREREHITQKPIEVMREIVRICPLGGRVLDPFAGSATTGVAALLEGRMFTGFELSPHFIEVGSRRLAEAEGGFVSGAQLSLL